MKRLFAVIVLSIYLVCFGFACCVQAEEVETRASEYIAGRSLNLSKNNGAVVATTSISCYDKCDKIGFSSLTIQENRNGVWTTVSSTSAYAYDARAFSKSLVYANIKSGK